MNGRTTTAAAVPLAIALMAATTLPTSNDARSIRFRAAPGAVSSAHSPGLTNQQESWLDEHNPFGIPFTSQPGNHTLIVREGYSLAHNNVDLIADWVAYRLTREETEGTERRPGDSAFKPDPLLPRGRRAERKDYQGWKDVYDRGHQCPANDAKGRGAGVMNDSFFLSNMTPQTSRLNQFKWRLLEDRIHKLAEKLGEVWVITGPVFVDDNDDGVIEYFVIGTNQVAVPTHYFKIVLAKSQTDPDRLQCMAFLIPNEAIDEHEFEDFLVSVDEIEKLTGFDFLQKLEPADEDLLEASVEATVWSVAD